MSFESKKIIENSTYNRAIGRWTIFKQSILFISILIGWYMLASAGVVWRKYVAKTLWPTPSSDSWSWSWSYSSWSKIPWSQTINVLLVWIGWKGHRGAYNTDTIIVASYNPRTKHLNMISIPRDLYVNIDQWYYSRINSILDYSISQKQYTLNESLIMLRGKVGNLIGQNIAYHALVDFQWFEQIIDTLWGIQVDVPEELYDPTFPVDDFTYGTLHINSGRQTMDGHTALNYARSRHSTSDFDRSARQQIIIKSVLQKLLSFGSLSKIKKLYSNVSSTVTTNIGINDILKYIWYANSVAHLKSIVFQADCPENLNQMKHGCVLYSPPRESFGGAAILLPVWATPTTVSDYTQLFAFVHRSIVYPFGDFQWLSISLYNSIDKNRVTVIPWFTSKLGVELIRNGLNVSYVGNNEIKNDKNMLFFLTWEVDQKVRASYTMVIEDILKIGDITLWDEKKLSDYYTWTLVSGSNVLLTIGTSAAINKR